MKSFLAIIILLSAIQVPHALAQESKVKPQNKLEEFVLNLFDSEKRAERKAKRIERRKKRQAAKAKKELESRPAPKTPIVSKPIPKVEEKPSCSLYDSMIPKCYHKRNDSNLNIALLYYGDYMKQSDLDRIEPILIERFSKATNKAIGVNIVVKKIIPFKQKMPADFSYNGITDKKRLQRIWYYDNVGTQIMNEVYEEYKKVESKEQLDTLDAIVAITGAQFDGLGFASGRVSVTEYPREIAWASDGGGRVDYISDFEIVDELIHELGHNLFLGHTSTQCQKPGMTYEEKQACCALSPSKDDVLSYCRKRAHVNENFMHGFESCNQDMIERLVVPAIINGGDWNLKNRSKCE